MKSTKVSLLVLASVMLLTSCNMSVKKDEPVVETPEPTVEEVQEPVVEEKKNELTQEQQERVDAYNAALMNYEQYEGREPSTYSTNALNTLGVLLDEAHELQDIPNNYMKPIRRLEFSKLTTGFIEEIMGVEMQVPEMSPFSDTNDVDVIKIYNAGILGGQGRREFNPDEPITREEVASIAIKTAQWLCNELNVDFNGIMQVGVSKLPLDDWFEVSAEYDIEVRLAYANKVMQGTEWGLFVPSGYVKREDAMIVINNVFNILVEQ